MFLDLNHKKLEVYNISLELLKECYSLTNNFPASELDAALEVSVALHYIERIIAEPVGKLIVSCFKKLSTMMQTLSKQ